MAVKTRRVKLSSAKFNSGIAMVRKEGAETRASYRRAREAAEAALRGASVPLPLDADVFKGLIVRDANVEQRIAGRVLNSMLSEGLLVANGDTGLLERAS